MTTKGSGGDQFFRGKEIAFMPEEHDAAFARLCTCNHDHVANSQQRCCLFTEHTQCAGQAGAGDRAVRSLQCRTGQQNCKPLHDFAAFWAINAGSMTFIYRT